MNGGRSVPRIAAAVALLAAAGPVAAQREARVSGIILDTSEAGIPEALITITNEDSGIRRTGYSRPDGAYAVNSLEPGLYKITARKEGFHTLVRFGVRVDASQTARVNFTMPVGSMQETITVEGDAAPLGRDDASVTTVVARDRIERLPLNGRGVLSLLELAPGTSVTPATRGEPGQFTTNGQRPNTHYFTVDGVSANTGVAGGGSPAQSTGGALPGMSAFGSLDALLPMEALEEFRVQTSSSVPEFGRLPGAIVSLASRSGTNEFHASLLYRFRHELLSANDWFANQSGEPRAPLRLQDIAPSLGGPLWRNRTFFFVSYEAMRLRQPFAWRAPVPSAASRRDAAEWVAPVLNMYPAPNGSDLGGGLAVWTGRSNRPSSLDAGTVRLDQAITSRITAFARYGDTPSSNQFGNTQVNKLDLRSRSITLGINYRPSASVVLDLRLNASTAKADSVWVGNGGSASDCDLPTLTARFARSAGSCLEFVRFSIAGVGQVISGREGQRRQDQWQAVPSVALNLANHSVKLGADYRQLKPQRRDASGSLSIIADSLQDLSDDRNLWVGSTAPVNASTVLTEISLWAQDAWRFSRDLTLNGGVRWEYSRAPVPAQPALYLDPVTGTTSTGRLELWPLRYGNVAPRLGAAYRIGKSGRTVLRAGAGLFYESSLSIATDMVNGGPMSISQFGSAIHAPFSTFLTFGFARNLELPRVLQWNTSVERAVGEGGILSASYVGAAGRHLLRREIGGEGSTPTVWLLLATNNGGSDYNGLQLQYRRRVAQGLQGRISYTWSHSLDNSSSDSVLHWAGSGLLPSADRGSSDFDLRHSFDAALTYEPQRGILHGWGLDGIFRARTGFPITVLADEYYQGIEFADAFRPDRVWGQPLWLPDASAPGKWRLNPAAFRAAPSSRQGSLGRNAVTGFGMSQLDVSVRRTFAWGERRSIELRVAAYNALNQANFGDPVRLLISPLFGQSPSMLNLMLGTGSPGSGLAPIFQTGGPRSLQAVIRLRF